MPYFINIGRFKRLKSGMGARGWHIWRREATVNVRFGPIEVHGRYPKHFIWAAEPVKKKWKKRSSLAAAAEIRKRIKEKESERRADGDKAYQRLTPGQKILKRGV